MDVGSTFMVNGIEYKVEVSKKNRISASLLSEEGELPVSPSMVLIGNDYYKIIYANKGQRFITLIKK